MFGRNKKLKNQKTSLSVIENGSIKNAAQSLLANIQFSSVDKPIKTVVVTSSIPNEGKSTIALSLAAAAGANGKHVLIIEGDLRRRSLRAAIHVFPKHGFYAVLSEDVPLEEAAIETPMRGVEFLDVEAGIPNPEELLSSKRFEELLHQARKDYDFVVIDTPPLAAFADAAVVSRLADGTVFVVREGQTDKRDAQLAVEQLRKSGAHLLGIVMNFIDTRGAGRYGYYYGYYYEEKSVPADSTEATLAREKQAEQQGDADGRSGTRTGTAKPTGKSSQAKRG